MDRKPLRRASIGAGRPGQPLDTKGASPEDRVPGSHLRFLDALWHASPAAVTAAACRVGQLLAPPGAAASQRWTAIDGMARAVVFQLATRAEIDPQALEAMIRGWALSQVPAGSDPGDGVYLEVMERVFTAAQRMDGEVAATWLRENLEQDMVEACLAAAGGIAMPEDRRRGLLAATFKDGEGVGVGDARAAYNGLEYRQLGRTVARGLGSSCRPHQVAMVSAIAEFLMEQAGRFSPDVLAHLLIGVTDVLDDESVASILLQVLQSGDLTLAGKGLVALALSAQHCAVEPDERFGTELSMAAAIRVDMESLCIYLELLTDTAPVDGQVVLLTCLMAAREAYGGFMPYGQAELLENVICLQMAQVADRCSREEVLDFATRYARCVSFASSSAGACGDEEGPGAGSFAIETKRSKQEDDPLKLLQATELPVTELLARAEEAYAKPGGLDAERLRSHCRQLCEEVDAPPALRSAWLVMLLRQGMRHVTPMLLVRVRRFIVEQVVGAHAAKGRAMGAPELTAAGPRSCAASLMGLRTLDRKAGASAADLARRTMGRWGSLSVVAAGHDLAALYGTLLVGHRLRPHTPPPADLIILAFSEIRALTSDALPADLLQVAFPVLKALVCACAVL